jgi:hypothetical protein
MDSLPDLISGGQVDIGFIRFPVKLPDTLRKHTLFEDFFAWHFLPTIHLY